MDLSEAQNSFEDLMSKISSNDLTDFFRWIQRQYLTSECLGEKPAIAYSTLNRISNDIKPMVPISGVMSSETVNYLSDGQNSDCNPNNTEFVDTFLYEDMDIDDLVKEGQLSRHYCLDCNSRKIKSLNFISHSASKRRISFIFTGFLKNIDFSNKTVLDVGSRLGALLYGAYVYTNAKQIIGIEMNSELCCLQNSLIQKYKFNDRIKVICSDVCALPELVNSSDVILLNNVFEFFQNPSKQVECWKFLQQNVKSGAILVTVPSLEESLKNLSQRIDLLKWVSRQEIREPLLAMSVEDLKELSEICVYRVI